MPSVLNARDVLDVAVDMSGAILLGDAVVTDGYRRKATIRTQSHIHEDHLGRFPSSKGVHDIVLHKATRDLLGLEGHPDLAWRENVYAPEYGMLEHESGINIELVDAGHMLGSAQIAVEYPDGIRVGYSGDFSWPLDKVIRVDQLVVDAAYGNSASVRRFSRAATEADFLQLVSDRLRKGVVTIKAHRGTLHRAAALLLGAFAEPVVVPNHVKEELNVYCRFGIPASAAVTTAPSEGRYIRLLGHRQAVERYSYESATTITLSGFRIRAEPIQVLSEDRTYSVCLSDHADFEETLEYISLTGARDVVVDNSRHGNGVELAIAITERLGIPAKFNLVEPDPF
jgi:putative mRNA 3-end processing factor